MELTQDDKQDACEFLEFFLRTADEDADLLAAYLRAVGLEPGTSFSQDTLLRLAAYFRLRNWETAGVIADSMLPTSDEVFADVLDKLEGRSARFETRELCKRVHLFGLRRLIWPQTSSKPFTLIDQSTPADFLDSIAELLWELRHLAGPGENSAASNDGLISESVPSTGNHQ
jgi:hypothetical protein